MKTIKKKPSYFWIILASIALGVLDGRTISRMDISRDVVNVTVFLIILFCAFLISYLLSERLLNRQFWKHFIPNFILMYMIYGFSYVWGIMSGFPPG